MRKTIPSLLANSASLLICGLLAGVVVAAAAFPAVAMSGLVAKAGSTAFGQLPVELQVKRSPQISYVYAKNNTLLATMYDENRRDLPLTEIPLVVRHAILAAEDQKFFTHSGVDALGIARALIANKSSGSVQQGASTLTMQFVRLSISYSATNPQEVLAATEDTNARKVREMRYAIAIEQKMTKDQILEGYLNTAYFGNRAYGIFAASQVYFGKQPKDLTVAEAAFLAALVKFPGEYNAETHAGEELAIQRRDYVIDEMVQTVMEGISLDAAGATTAKAEKLKIVGKVTPNGCVQATTNHWGFFCDYFQRWWLQQDVFGATSYDRERQLKSGGYRIVTSLDPVTQNAAKKHIETYLPTGKPEALMLAAIEPGTGKVRALATNRFFKLDTLRQNKVSSDPAKKKRNIKGTYPNTTNPLMTGGADFGGYQAGSAFKIFTVVAALEKGYPLDYNIAVNPGPVHTRFPISGPDANCGGYYCPSNANKNLKGTFNMWTGFGSSINTFFVPLAERVGVQNVVNAAKRMGISFYDDPDPKVRDDLDLSKNSESWGAFTLGVSTTTPLELANAFATLAADGVYCEPTPIESITDIKGSKLDVGGPRCNQAIGKEVARAAIDAARCSPGDESTYGECNGAATNRASRTIVGKPIAGKTGTTDRSKSATLTLTTRQLAVSGFMANPDWAEAGGMKHEVVNPAVQYTLRDAMKGKSPLSFAKPTYKMAYGTQVSIPSVTCKTVDAAKSILRNVGFEVQVDPTPVDSACAAGQAAGTNPTGRTIKDGVVIIQVSNGKGAKPPVGGPVVPPGQGPGHNNATILTCLPLCGREAFDQ